MVNIIIIMVGFVVLSAILIFLFAAYNYMNGKEKNSVNEFPSSGNILDPTSDWFPNFDKFKKKVHNLAKKDSEIENYLKSQKNRMESVNANIHDSGESRENDSKDI